MKSEEIKAQIEQVSRQIYDLRAKKEDLTGKYRDALQSEFEAAHGIKSGDKLTTKSGMAVFYDCMIVDAIGQVVVFCHPVKNDGTASKAGRHLYIKDF